MILMFSKKAKTRQAERDKVAADFERLCKRIHTKAHRLADSLNNGGGCAVVAEFKELETP